VQPHQAASSIDSFDLDSVFIHTSRMPHPLIQPVLWRGHTTSFGSQFRQYSLHDPLRFACRPQKVISSFQGWPCCHPPLSPNARSVCSFFGQNRYTSLFSSHLTRRKILFRSSPALIPGDLSSFLHYLLFSDSGVEFAIFPTSCSNSDHLPTSGRAFRSTSRNGEAMQRG